MKKRWSDFLRVRLSLLLTAALVLGLLPMSALAEETPAQPPANWPTTSWAAEAAKETNKKPWETRWDSTKGENSPTNPYVIENDVELILFGQLKAEDTEGKFYALKEGQTYDMGAHYMFPLFPTVYSGTEGMDTNYFGGTLLGNGAQITNAYIQCFDKDKDLKFVGGLFSKVSGGTVKKLTVTGTMWGGIQYIGGLAGALTDRTETVNEGGVGVETLKSKGRLEDCTVTMQFIAPDDSEFFGGLAGQATGSTVTECTATVEGSLGASEVENASVGGLMGGASESTVSYCEATVKGSLGASEGGIAYVGGLVGQAKGSEVTDCKAVVEGSLSAKGASAAAGGLVGDADGSTGIQKGSDNTIQFTTGTLSLNTCSAEVKGSISAENTDGSAAAAGGLVGNVNGSTTISEGNASGKVNSNVPVTGGSITITGCTATVENGSISAKGVNAAAGGLAGCVDDRTIIDKGNNYKSDLVEVTITGVSIAIEDCTFNVTDVSAEGANSAAGGLVGHADSSTSITENENHSAVSGLNGSVTGGSITIDDACKAAVMGSISAGSAAGGLVGRANGSTTIDEDPGDPYKGNGVFTVQRSSAIDIDGSATVAGHISANAAGGQVGYAAGSLNSTNGIEIEIIGGKIIVTGDPNITIRGSATAQTDTGGPQGAVGGSQNTTITFSDSSATTLTLGNGGVGVTLTGDDKAASVTDAEMVFDAHDHAVVVSRNVGDVTIPAEITPFTVTSDGAITLPEGWHLVTFDSQGCGPVNGQVIAADGTVAKPADPTRSGYTFVGWYNGGVPYDFSAPIIGSLTLTAQWNYNGSSGGGDWGGGSSDKETVKNPDGSTTTTETKKDGTVVEETKRPDGSTTVIETKPDGTVITTDKDKAGNKTEVVEKPDGSMTTTIEKVDGTVTVTVVDPDGKVLAEVKLTDKALEGKEAVDIPMPALPSSSDRENAPTVTLGVPDGVTVKVEIPVEAPRPGTVAILVNEDGSEEIVRTSVAIEDGVALTVEGVSTVKIVDNSKDFVDVPAQNWAADAVDFVSARELFNGTSATTFAPDLPMSRAMLAKVLHNLENNPDAGLNGIFPDVDNGAWYAEAVSWAADKGIVSGYPDGSFGANDSISREQLAVMLWNYAGKPAADQKLGFKDADQISGYAQAAIQWAVENGILSGKGGNVLDPKGQATRAEVASMLMRFCENIK